MFTIDEKRSYLKVKRYYFTDEQTDISSNADIVMVHGKKKIDSSINTVIERVQNTLITDLTVEVADLFQQIHKNYRYEIRRAEKEGIEWKIYDCNSYSAELQTVVNEFDECYGELFRSKGLKDKFNRWLVEELIRVKKITISVASFRGERLCFHCYLQDKPYTELMYSVSKRNYDGADKNLVGYANKMLHWKDFEYFKAGGYEKYDWGGIGSLENISGIAAFKIAFGGTHSQKVSYFIGRTLLGKITLKAKCLMEKRK